VFKITKEAFDDNLYKSQIGLQGTADMKLLRDAFDRTKEFEAASVFNNAQSRFSSSIT